MTPIELKAARKSLGLSQAGLAEALRLGPNGERTIRRWETGEIPVTGPASVAIELMLERSRIPAKADQSPKGEDAKRLSSRERRSRRDLPE